MNRRSRLVKLAERLRLYKPDHNELVTDTRNRAAVLICLFEDENGEIRVILTKRSSTMSSYPGQVALPGGMREECDKNDTETALRESNEEIGLDPSLVEVLTTLESYGAGSYTTVFPVIGILWDKNDFKPVPNAVEVESVFDVPLDIFLKNENRREEEIGSTETKHLMHFFDYQVGDECYVIWGMTAAILIRVATLVYQRPPGFERRMPKYWNRSRH